MNRWTFEIFLICSLIQIFLRHFKGRFEDVYSIERSTHQHFEVNRVVTDLFYLLLTLM